MSGFQREYEKWRKREESRAAGTPPARPAWKQKKRIKIVRRRDLLFVDSRARRVFDYLYEHMAELGSGLLRFEAQNLSCFSLYPVEKSEPPEALLEIDSMRRPLLLRNVLHWAECEIAIIYMEKPGKDLADTKCIFEIVGASVRFKASFEKAWGEFADSLARAVNRRSKAEKMRVKQAQVYERQGYGAWA